jgi:hypothetical protein
LESAPAICAGTSWQKTYETRQVISALYHRIQIDIQNKKVPDYYLLGEYLAAIKSELIFTALNKADPKRLSLAQELYDKAIIHVSKHRAVILRVIDLLKRTQIDMDRDSRIAHELITATFDCYAEAVLSFLEGVVDDATLREIKAINSALSSLARQDYLSALIRFQAVPTINELIDKYASKSYKKVIVALRKHGYVLAQIAAASNPEDVVKILEAASSPAGSWREYRTRPWAGFVAATMGIAVGTEQSFGGEDGYYTSASIPLGVETARALYADWTIGVMLSVVDLGNVTNLRLKNATNDQMAKDGTAQSKTDFDFASVISPGVSLQIGLGKTPFVLAFGAQFVPAARRIFDCSNEEACSNTRLTSGVRFGISLAVDVPVFSLW